jgi:Mn2+/Fe2+ NRAMP family transporter
VNIGGWAFIIIALAAFTTMFSTTLTCFDAYARVMSTTSKLLFKIKREVLGTLFWMIMLLAGTLVLLVFFGKNMKQMVDFATTLSFVLAPVIALLNYLVVTGKDMPSALKPGGFMRIYAVLSLLVLSGFSVFYIIWRFF